MPTKPTPGMTSEESEELSKVMTAARKENDKFLIQFAGRSDEIDTLETEIISEYTNSDDLKLGSVSDHLQVQVVLSTSQRYLSRVTEIHLEAVRNVTKLKAAQAMLMNAILPLVKGSSAEIRNAHANNGVSGINYMIALEEGLITICELAMKNLRTAQEMASRTLKAFEIDISFFDGANTFSAIVAANKKRLLGNIKVT